MHNSIKARLKGYHWHAEGSIPQVLIPQIVSILVTYTYVYNGNEILFTYYLYKKKTMLISFNYLEKQRKTVWQLYSTRIHFNYPTAKRNMYAKIN